MSTGEPFQINERVLVRAGPFANFYGKVKSINQKSHKILVDVDAFGRITPVEFSVEQLQKL
jgi:transcriptional antiterminator NusG